MINFLSAAFPDENFPVYQGFLFGIFPVCQPSCLGTFLPVRFLSDEFSVRTNFPSENLPVYYTSCLMIFLSTCLHFCVPSMACQRVCLSACPCACRSTILLTFLFVCLLICTSIHCFPLLVCTPATCPACLHDHQS